MPSPKPAHILIPAELRDRLKVLAAEEGTTIGKIVSELIEVRLGRNPNGFNFPSHIRAKIYGTDWKQRVREYIEPLSLDESFNVPFLMRHLGLTQEQFPVQGDRLLIAGIIRAYLETLPGVFPGPEVPGKPFGRVYYLSKDAAEQAHEEAAAALWS